MPWICIQTKSQVCDVTLVLLPVLLFLTVKTWRAPAEHAEGLLLDVLFSAVETRHAGQLQCTHQRSCTWCRCRCRYCGKFQRHSLQCYVACLTCSELWFLVGPASCMAHSKFFVQQVLERSEYTGIVNVSSGPYTQQYHTNALQDPTLPAMHNREKTLSPQPSPLEPLAER